MFLMDYIDNSESVKAVTFLLFDENGLRAWRMTNSSPLACDGRVVVFIVLTTQPTFIPLCYINFFETV